LPLFAVSILQHFCVAAAELNGVIYALGGFDGKDYLMCVPVTFTVTNNPFSPTPFLLMQSLVFWKLSSKHLLLLICNMWNCFAIHKENLQSYSCSNTNAICVLCLLAFPGAAAFFDSMQDICCMLKTLCLRFLTHSIHGSMCKKTFPQIYQIS
jgi:hypothetical protein